MYAVSKNCTARVASASAQTTPHVPHRRAPPAADRPPGSSTPEDVMCNQSAPCVSSFVFAASAAQPSFSASKAASSMITAERVTARTCPLHAHGIAPAGINAVHPSLPPAAGVVSTARDTARAALPVAAGTTTAHSGQGCGLHCRSECASHGGSHAEGTKELRTLSPAWFATA
jgi:hypothetical protein